MGHSYGKNVNNASGISSPVFESLPRRDAAASRLSLGSQRQRQVDALRVIAGLEQGPDEGQC